MLNKKIRMLCWGIGLVILLLLVNMWAPLAEKDYNSRVMEEGIGNLDLQQLNLNEFEAVNCNVEGNVFRSLEEDSWLVKHFDEGRQINKIVIDIAEMNVDTSQCTVFYDTSLDEISGDYYVKAELKSGRNEIGIEAGADIGTIRLDLCEKKGIIINIESIKIE